MWILELHVYHKVRCLFFLFIIIVIIVIWYPDTLPRIPHSKVLQYNSRHFFSLKFVMEVRVWSDITFLPIIYLSNLINFHVSMLVLQKDSTTFVKTLYCIMVSSIGYRWCFHDYSRVASLNSSSHCSLLLFVFFFLLEFPAYISYDY